MWIYIRVGKPPTVVKEGYSITLTVTPHITSNSLFFFLFDVELEQY
jgi:hypothetical protein